MLLAVAACAGGPAGPTPLPSPSPTPIPSPKAVVISIDGLRPDAFTSASGAAAPHILDLARRGAYTWSAQTIVPAMTLPAHSSMLSGVAPAVHGLTWDDWRPERGCISVPTVFGIARAAGLRTVMVVGKEKFRQLDAPYTVSSFVLSTGDADVANQAIVQVQAGFDLMFVHFPDTDLAGHANGWLSTSYLAKVTEADHAVGRLLAALPPETTVILSADHGGHSNTHGLVMAEDMTIPWVIAGPRVAGGGRELQRPVRTVDTAATALYVLGLSLPPTASGVVVAEAFAPR
jgi:predicted AlkP superfamily pyrophosphatase or phosphodiesterase